MIVWLDAQLPPALAGWMTERFGVSVQAVRDLGLHRATDRAVFAAPRAGGALVMTKDPDFVTLLGQQRPPPQVVWLTIGNTSTPALKQLLERTWPRAADLLAHGEPLVEIGRAI